MFLEETLYVTMKASILDSGSLECRNLFTNLPDLFDINGFGDKFACSAIESFVDVVLLIVRANHYDYNLVWQCVFCFKILLMIFDLYSFCIAIHFRHIYVGEYDLVVYVAARLCHIFVVHVYSYLSIDSFIAFFLVFKFYHRFERHQIEQNIIHQEYLCFTAALIAALIVTLITILHLKTVLITV